MVKSQDFSEVTAVVVSADMIAYGGLIASRTNDTPYDLAQRRIRALEDIRKAVPKVKFYVFSSITRLYPPRPRKQRRGESI